MKYAQLAEQSAAYAQQIMAQQRENLRLRGIIESQGNELVTMRAQRDELLAVVTEFLRCSQHMEAHDELPDDTCPADLSHAARAAIRKARGEA